MGNSFRQRFKGLVSGLHGLIARSRHVSTCYLWVAARLVRCLPDRPLKNQIAANLSLFAWPLDRLPPIRCRLSDDPVGHVLVPHPGMLDFQAMFHRAFEYEPEVVRFLRDHLAEVDTVIEIGANVGLFTLLFARHLAGRGQVHSFEPAPRTYRALQENLEANAIGNVSTVNAAVFDRRGVATFYEPVVAAFGYRDLTRSSLVESHARWQAAEVREYQVATVGPAELEPLLASGKRTLIKLDIEGAEKQVLIAMEPLLRRYRPEIVMEVLHRDADAFKEVAFLPEIYQLFHLTDAGPVQHDHFVGDPSYRFRDYFLSPRWH